MGSVQVIFRSVCAHLFQNLDHLALLRAYNVHTMLQLHDALARWCVDGASNLWHFYLGYNVFRIILHFVVFKEHAIAYM